MNDFENELKTKELKLFEMLTKTNCLLVNDTKQKNCLLRYLSAHHKGNYAIRKQYPYGWKFYLLKK